MQLESCRKSWDWTGRRFQISSPVVLVGLVEDTGTSNTDGITSNPAVSGSVSDDGTITSFRAGLDGMLPSDYVDVTADLQGTSFVFSRARLEQILGAPLARRHTHGSPSGYG